MNIDLSDSELSCIRCGLEDYIREWIKFSNSRIDVQRSYVLYIRCGGHDWAFSEKELAKLREMVG